MKSGEEEKAKQDSSVASKACFNVATAASSAPYHVAQGKFSIELTLLICNKVQALAFMYAHGLHIWCT